MCLDLVHTMSVVMGIRKVEDIAYFQIYNLISHNRALYMVFICLNMKTITLPKFKKKTF